MTLAKLVLRVKARLVVVEILHRPPSSLSD